MLLILHDVFFMRFAKQSFPYKWLKLPNCHLSKLNIQGELLIRSEISNNRFLFTSPFRHSGNMENLDFLNSLLFRNSFFKIIILIFCIFETQYNSYTSLGLLIHSVFKILKLSRRFFSLCCFIGKRNTQN